MSATFASLRVPRISWSREKVEVVPWSGSASEVDVVVRQLKRKGWALLPLPVALIPTKAFASGPTDTISHTVTEALKAKVVSAFEPLIGVIQALSYPLALAFLSTGFLLIISGRRQKGLESIKWAAIGFLGMQLVPGIMSILLGVGDTISTGTSLPGK